MCGIAGIWRGRAASTRDELLGVTRRMTGAIAHRGPDGSGEWIDEDQGLGLGHLRLAIIDVSADGAQPMTSHDGRFVFLYNGEIYNYRDIRREIDDSAQPAKWRGHSDTEVFLEGFARWGVRDTLRRVTGMFAFALWDRERQELHLGRDRLGEKPLYWGVIDGDLVFASELHAMRAIPGFDPGVEPRAVAEYLRLGYVPAPWSILRGVSKLRPGTVATFSRGTTGVAQRGEPDIYWSLKDVAQAGMASPLPAEGAQLRAELKQRLRGAVARQMVADVPVGAFLSGGIDSSAVVALMCQASAKVRTFSIGFDMAAFDESAHAAAVARHLGTDHTEIRFTERQALDIVPELPRIYDEPFADSSQLPTTLVSRETRRHVTVALTGDAGDELFWGYDRYRQLARLAGTSAVAAPLARMGLRLVASMAGRLGRSRAADRAAKLADLLMASGVDDTYVRLMSMVPGEMPWAGAGAALRDRWHELDGGLFERMAYTDQHNYLPDDVLVKVDRASMHFSLETRVPLLDHSLVEFAWRVPAEFKSDLSGGKKLMRELLFEMVPRELVDRPKAGFAVPLDSWLRGPLREWLCDALSEPVVRDAGWVDPRQVRRMLDEHLSGRRRWHTPLWSFAMLHQWLAAPRAEIPASLRA